MKKGKIGFGKGIGAGRKVLFVVVLAAMLMGAAGCSEKETILLDSEDLVRLEGADEGSDTLSVDRGLVPGMASNVDVIAASGEGSGTEPERTEEDAFRAGGGNTGEGGNGVEISTLFVHICGEVMRPGVYELPEGSRVYEAVEAAGGIRDGGAADYLNLAETLKDGMKLEVPSESQAEEWKAQGIKPAADPEAKARHMVNLNTATREELMSLRGIGESRAEDIIHYREAFGGFKSIEDIMNVSGIKDAAFEKIKDSITV